MNIVVISDTHGLHRQLDLPEGDVLLHAGDVSTQGTQAQIVDFLDWFSSQPHPHKVFIAGNHDFFFETQSKEAIEAVVPPNVHYLNEGVLELNGLKIWGSPITPIPNKRWAFNRNRGADIQPHWDLIPSDLDVLLVHGPAKGVLDTTLRGEQVGCQDLLEAVLKQKPKLFIFGHIHESRGQVDLEGIQFINASSVDRYATRVFPPFVLHYPLPAT